MNHRSRRAAVFVLCCLCLTAADRAEAQLSVSYARYFADRDWNRLSLSYGWSTVIGLRASVAGTWYGGSGNARLWGAEAGIMAFEGGRPGPFLAAGVGAGLGAGSLSGVWGTWSAGGGWEFRLASIARLSVEARYRRLGAGSGRGVEIGARFALGGGASGRRPRAAAASEPASQEQPSLSAVAVLPGDAAVVTLADSVVQTALGAMGTPYAWGGDSISGGGFDCSGLIQYAYRQHGISLPRRSADQAREGIEVPKDLAGLKRGDILTFSNRRDGTITHVGLYVGDGRFIHSATGGVQTSVLSADDPYGRWWWERWVGARRVVPQR